MKQGSPAQIALPALLCLLLAPSAWADAVSGALYTDSLQDAPAVGGVSIDVVCSNQKRALNTAQAALTSQAAAGGATHYDPLAPELQAGADAYVSALNSYRACRPGVACEAPRVTHGLSSSLRISFE